MMQSSGYNSAINPYANTNVTPCEPAPPCFFGDLASRVQRLQQVIADSNEALLAVRSRVFGPWPTNACSTEAPKPDGQAAEVIALLDALIERAADARDIAQYLNGRI